MKSGLEGRNNPRTAAPPVRATEVSMKSGLEGRNNAVNCTPGRSSRPERLNEVRPRRPEQSVQQ